MSGRAEQSRAAAGAVPRRRRDYPGWRMVWVLAVTEAISYGALFYAFAVMLVPMRESFGAGTGQVSIAATIALGSTGLASVPAGRWLDRHGARALMTAGSLLGGASVVAWSQARNLPQLYLAFVGIGLAGAAVFYEPAVALINTWFRRDRNAALLTLTVVAGFSSTVFLPLSQLMVDAFGWRRALLVLAALTAACAVPHALVLRRSPADLGLHVDGTTPDSALDAGAPHLAAASADTPATARLAWRRPAVRRLTGAIFLEALAVTIVVVHLITYLRDSGIDAGTAAAAAGAIGIAQVAGRLVLTATAARFGVGRVAAAMVAGQAAGVAALFALPLAIGAPTFVVFFGAGVGVMSIARPALLGDYVAPEIFATVSGGQNLAANAARVLAPVSAGTVISLAGYGPAFAVVAVCSLGAALLVLLADRST